MRDLVDGLLAGAVLALGKPHVKALRAKHKERRKVADEMRESVAAVCAFKGRWT